MQAESENALKILVIEDGADAQANLREILSMDGHEFDFVSTVSDAIGQCGRTGYSAIILDWTLPDGTGETLLPQLRQRCPQAAILVITGTVGLSGTVAAIRHEAVDYHVKPLDAGALRASLRRIGERRQLALAKERSDAALRALLEAAPCAILIFRPNRTLVYFSPHATRLTGYTAEETLGKDYHPLLVRDTASQKRIDTEVAIVLRSGQTRGFENPVWCKDGSRRWLIWNAERLDDYDAGVAILAVGQDISARRMAEQRLMAEHATARIIAAGTETGDTAPNLLRAICENLGWDRGEWWEFDSAAGALRCQRSWYAPAAKADEIDLLTHSLRLAPGVGLAGSAWLNREPIWFEEFSEERASAQFNALTSAGFRSAVAFAVEFEQCPLAVLVFFGREAQSPEPELRSCVTSLGSQIGQFMARKRAEQRALQNERLAAVGEVMDGLIHEGRNALQRSQACLEMLVMEVEGNAEAIRLIDRAQEAQNRLHGLYELVREYATPLELNREVHHLGEILNDAWDALNADGRQRYAQLNHDGNDLDLRSSVDRAKLLHVYRVILDNSLSATNEPVEIQAIWSEALSDGRPALQVAIKDNGPGLTAEAREKIFHPFNTTKTHGLGLGLATAKRYIEAHDGTIVLRESGAPGAEFVVTLPRRQGAKTQPMQS